MSGMAEVLGQHVQSARNSRCTCGEWRPDMGKGATIGYRREHREHVAAMLSAAGYGPVAEAKAEALEDAAGALYRGTVRDPYGRATHDNYADWLRNRAAAVRGEG